MSFIVVEGPDATGKSTLVDELYKFFGTMVQRSEGPEPYPGEINERVRRYNMERIQPQQKWQRFFIYDRHPCVSQMIYNQFNGTTPVELELINQFYQERPFFIYARRQMLDNHQAKEHDDHEHLRMIKEKNLHITHLYDRWAIEHAHMIYRIGDPYEPILHGADQWMKQWQLGRLTPSSTLGLT